MAVLTADVASPAFAANAVVSNAAPVTPRVPGRLANELAETVISNVDVDSLIGQTLDGLWDQVLTSVQEMENKRDRDFLELTMKMEELSRAQVEMERESASTAALLGCISTQLELCSQWPGLGAGWCTTPVCPTPVPPQLYLPPVLPSTTQERVGSSHPSISLSIALGLEDAEHGKAETASNVFSETGTDEQSFTFSLTLRVADGGDLGLMVVEDPSGLLIESVCNDGAAGAWNRLCVGSSKPKRMLLPKDYIVSVNGIAGDASPMLEEIKTKKLLKFNIARGFRSEKCAYASSGELSSCFEAVKAAADGGTTTPTTRTSSMPGSPQLEKEISDALANVAWLQGGVSIVI